MAVRPEFREFALEQLGRVVPVTSRSMFGGVGIYAEGLFFALLAEDTVYLKVDDGNRGDFESRGLGPFRPFADGMALQYYPVPEELIEDPDALRPWVHGALDAARRARARKARKR